MPLKIVRNDITKMQVDAIVNTANCDPIVGPGCDYAIYQAAGFDELLSYRTEKIGHIPEGKAFITPAFGLGCRAIIHAVSPRFIDGNSGEEEKLRSCYRESLRLVAANGFTSVAFPLIGTGSFGHSKEEGMRVAVDEINAFLMKHNLTVYIVVFGAKATNLASRISEDIEEYIDENYVDVALKMEYKLAPSVSMSRIERPQAFRDSRKESIECDKLMASESCIAGGFEDAAFSLEDEDALDERIKHLTDTFSEYLMYLIDSRGMNHPDVYKRAIVDKKAFNKIKNNPNAHPKKITAMCLCVGAKLNMDQTKDLLARAGYALSPCDKTDIIFSYFIENEIYDMIELDIQLENHGLPCLID